ncbi:MAG: ABC transporter substrate-binding protein [Actinomycetia bacterium]|nr:ABC transporter substrate-binding protein [Actinomycetes bacterium]
MNRHPLRLTVALAVAGLVLAGCSPSSSPAPSSTTTSGITLVSPGSLTICVDVPYKPMEYADTNGDVVGFDIDFARLVADRLGVKLSVIQSVFAQIWSGANFAAKKCDLGWSSISITDARKQAVLFSIPYFEATQALGVGLNSGINGLADLKGKNLSVQSDTTGADYADANKDKYGYNVVMFDDGGTALNALLSGRADASLVDNAITRAFVYDNKTSVKVATEFQTGETYGVAAKIDDANAAKLMDLVNEVLTTANQDGTYLKIYQKWIDPAATSAGLPKA